MTRYANLGFKRKYVQAGFDETKGQNAEKDEISKTVGGDPVSSKDEPSKKKRKSAKQIVSKAEDRGEGTSGVSKDASKEEAGSEEPKVSNRKLYKLRRQKEFKEKMKARQQENASAKRSEKRRLLRVKNKTDETTCFACREKGHSVKDCPQNTDSNTIASGICFRCGSKKHSLSKCKKPVPDDPSNPLPFATCFVCQSSGHLASGCPSNKAKGIYPNGGCCKVCGETSHLAKDCEIRSSDPQKDSILVGSGTNVGADEDDFHVVSRGRKEVNEEEGVKKPKGKIKKLVGGKIIVRVDDEPPKPVARKPPPPALVAKVKTVVF